MAIWITVWIQELFSGFVTIGRYGKWLTDINLLLILIRQMAAMVRRALAEVRTVPVLLVGRCDGITRDAHLPQDGKQRLVDDAVLGDVVDGADDEPRRRSSPAET